MKSNDIRISDQYFLTSLINQFPINDIRHLMDEVVPEYVVFAELNKKEPIPAHLFIYLVIAMSVFPHLNQTEILRRLFCSHEDYFFIPTMYENMSSQIQRAKTKLGSKLFEEMANHFIKPVISFEEDTNNCNHGQYNNWHLITLDIGRIPVPETPENQNMPSFIKIDRDLNTNSIYFEFITLIENTSNVMFGAQPIFDQANRNEIILSVHKNLTPKMLCISSPKIFLSELWDSLSKRTNLLWKIESNMRLKCVKRYPDGSYLSYIYPNKIDMKRQKNRIPIRLIKYRLFDRQQNTTDDKVSQIKDKLITSVLDYKQAPAIDLIKLYIKRAKLIDTFDWYKQNSSRDQFLFRSKTPDLVIQEFFGFLLADYVIKKNSFTAFQQIIDSDDQNININVTICT